MKKTLLLLLLPFLFLVGCGGSGIDTPTADTGGGTGSGSNVAGLQNVTVYIPPYQGAVQKALVNNIPTPNAARLVATHETAVGYECINPTTQENCDPDEPEDCTTVQTCNDILGSTPASHPSDWKVKIELVAEAISDGELDDSGSGTVGIAVPPGDNYTLHIITYVSGDFDKVGDTFTKDTSVEIGTNGRIVMGANTRNIMRKYAKSGEFDLGPGEEFNASTIMSAYGDPATLILPLSPVLAGDSYEVEADKSECLGDNWYIQQLLDQADLSGKWFISEGGDVDGTSAGNTMELDTDIVAGPPPVRTLWNFAQFFISTDMLASGESWTKWSFCTTDAGDLNPWGIVTVE